MYGVALAAHSLVRWVVVLSGAAALAAALSGWRSGRPYAGPGARAGAIFAAALDVQLLLGLSLYLFLSPATRAAFAAPGAAMGDPALRYWMVEHPLPALAAVALAHLGRSRARRAEGAAAWRRAALFFAGAALAIALAVPWPWLATGRPLLRF